MADVEYGVGEAPHADEPVDVHEKVVVEPIEGKSKETAQALLDAAESLGYQPSAVGFSDGAFVVGSDIAEAASLPEGDVAHPSVVGGDLPGGEPADGDGGAGDGSDSGSGDDSEADDKPTEKNTRAEIDAWGARHGIDTTGAANKADAVTLLG